MILYTMMPQESIFPTREEQVTSSTQLMLSYNGIPVLAEQAGGMDYQIVRVMSTDPSHFLNSECMPGTKITIT